MDRSRGLEDFGPRDLILTSDDIAVILKAMNAYGYALILAGALAELYKVKRIAQQLSEQMPPPEYDA